MVPSHALSDVLNAYESGGYGLPVKVQTADGGEFLALLDAEFSRSAIRLISVSSFLGREARVAVPRRDSSEVVVWTVLVLWTMRLPDGLFENGAVRLDRSVGGPGRR